MNRISDYREIVIALTALMVVAVVIVLNSLGTSLLGQGFEINPGQITPGSTVDLGGQTLTLHTTFNHERGRSAIQLQNGVTIQNGTLILKEENTEGVIRSIFGATSHVENVTLRDLKLVSSGPATTTFNKAIDIGSFSKLRITNCDFENIDGCRMGDMGGRKQSRGLIVSNNWCHNTGVFLGLFFVERYSISSNVYYGYEKGGELVDFQDGCKNGAVVANVVHHRSSDGGIEGNNLLNTTITGNFINSDGRGGHGIHINTQEDKVGEPVTSNISITGNVITNDVQSDGGIIINVPNNPTNSVLKDITITSNALHGKGGRAITIIGGVNITTSNNVTSGYDN